MPSLTYVQVESETAYIDSRVYCRDIIQVHHGDWVSNVLYKHQDIMTDRFGSIRFENASNYRMDGSYNPKPEKYALLTEAQCNFALSLSNNSPSTVIKKADLVEDFEKAKQQLKEQFQRQFAATPATPDLSDRVIQLEREMVEIRATLAKFTDQFSPNFVRSLETVAKHSGCRSGYTYVLDILLREYSEGKDYQVNRYVWNPWKYTLTQQAANRLLCSLRGSDGTNTQELPELIVLDRDAFFHPQNPAKNRRHGTQQ